MNPGRAFPGLSARCRWRTMTERGYQCRFNPNTSAEQAAECTFDECPALALGMASSCIAPTANGDVAASGAQRGGSGDRGARPKNGSRKQRQAAADPLKSAMDLLTGLMGPSSSDQEDDQ